MDCFSKEANSVFQNLNETISKLRYLKHDEFRSAGVE
jgi:hypothetical protein